MCIRDSSTCVLAVVLYGSETWTLTQADWKRLDSFHMRCQRWIIHTRWYDFVSNNEVLRWTGLLAASSIVRKLRLGLFGHVARLTEDVPANQILRTCCKAQDGARPSPDWKRARGRPPITWIHQICWDTGITSDRCSAAGRRPLVLATNRNGGMLRLNASRLDDDDDESK